MTDQTAAEEGEPEKKKSKKPMLIGLILALLLGGAGFYAVWSGMILGHAEESAEVAEEVVGSTLPDVAFVPIPALIINLGRDGKNNHLRFQAQLEVHKAAEQEVTDLLPRVVDVLNSYLRAVGTAELEDPSALVRLRAQMLRRIQVVTGTGRVRDLLIMEFVLS